MLDTGSSSRTVYTLLALSNQLAIPPFAYTSISRTCEVIRPFKNIYVVLYHLSHEENADRF